MDALRQELLLKLDAYLGGTLSLREILEWELAINDDEALERGLRGDLDRIALIGEEVEDGIREESELKELAMQMTGRVPDPPRRPR